MAINYFEGVITEVKQPVIHLPLHLKDMEELSEGYCTADASWFSMDTKAYLDVNELCYDEGQLSEEICSDNWLRVLRLPDEIGYIVDGSHFDDFQDDHGKFVAPLRIYPHAPYDGAEVVEANDYVKNRMQLEGLEDILRNQFGYRLGKSILKSLAEIVQDEAPEEE